MVVANEADCFRVDFPRTPNWRDKALLMTCAVFIDYLQFEKPNNNNNNRTRHSGFSD